MPQTKQQQNEKRINEGMAERVRLQKQREATPPQIKPATPLPWTVDPEGEVAVSIEASNGAIVCEVRGASNDPAALAAYIAHACNNYPKLVEALRGLVHGEASGNYDRAIALLSELGEE